MVSRLHSGLKSSILTKVVADEAKLPCWTRWQCCNVVMLTSFYIVRTMTVDRIVPGRPDSVLVSEMTVITMTRVALMLATRAWEFVCLVVVAPESEFVIFTLLERLEFRPVVLAVTSLRLALMAQPLWVVSRWVVDSFLVSLISFSVSLLAMTGFRLVRLILGNLNGGKLAGILLIAVMLCLDRPYVFDLMTVMTSIIRFYGIWGVSPVLMKSMASVLRLMSVASGATLFKEAKTD